MKLQEEAVSVLETAKRLKLRIAYSKGIWERKLEELYTYIEVLK